MSILRELQDQFRQALAEVVPSGDVEQLLGMIRPAQDSRFGDYQANMAMSLKGQLGRDPREIATELVAKLPWQELCEPPEVAGPGFINLRIRPEVLARRVSQLASDERLGVAPAAHPESIVVDFSAPNVAKPMHVGHIRSTVIGAALCRILSFLGHQVIGDNHLGDWGTQFGMIIYGYRHFVQPEAYAAEPVAELGRVYKRVRTLMDYHAQLEKLPQLESRSAELSQHLTAQRAKVASAEAKQAKELRKDLGRLEQQWGELQEEIAETRGALARVQSHPELLAEAQQHAEIGKRVLEETAKLHAGDAENLRLWAEFLPKCREEIERIYARLGVTFDEQLGESFYHDRLAGVVADLQQRGLAVESEGAKCIFLEGFDAPMLIQKQDGAYLYATTDLATIAYRVERWHPDRILYVVDFRQSEHFKKLFEVARRWGYQQEQLVHVSFGTVLGEDGKPFKTRSGDTVGLEGLLDEAIRKAASVVIANDEGQKGGPELSAEQRARIAEVVGIGAIKYADLSQNRTSDYVFSFEKMIAMQGNTATYLQYSYARMQNIFAKAGVAPEAILQATITLEHAAERALALQLLRFADALHDVVVDYRPNFLTNYLFELAKRFSEFYESCSVLRAESTELQASRLKLCWGVARTLRCGLNLLGIDVVDKM